MASKPFIAAGEQAAALERFDPKAPGLLADPYPTYHRYRAADPVHWGVPGLAGYPGAWYLFRYADAVTVLKHPRCGKERRNVKFSGSTGASDDARPAVPEVARPFFETARNFLVHRDPPNHTRLRLLMNTAFTPLAVEGMRPRVEALSHQLIDDVEAQGEMDFIADFAYPLPSLVITEMLGIPDADRKLFMAWSKDLQAVDLKTTDEIWSRASRSIEEAKAYIDDLVAERRRKPRQDLVSSLVSAHEQGGEIGEEELVANIFFLYFAGAGLETTTGFIGNGAHALLQHPHQQEMLRTDPELMVTAVEEMLRYESPVQMTNRIALEDFAIDGRQIRTGDSILVLLGAANRDGAVFADPDRFDITRRDNRHHAFGLGPHYCLGAPLGRLEGEVSFRILLERLPRLRLHPGKPPVWGENAAIRSLRSLPVTF